MPEPSFVGTFDLVETVEAIARLFKTDKVFIVGSQSILLSWPEAPMILRTSGEIGAYPGNAKIWEITQKNLDRTTIRKRPKRSMLCSAKARPSTSSTAFILTESTRIPRDCRKIGPRGLSIRKSRWMVAKC
jgi:hypothetical protein